MKTIEKTINETIINKSRFITVLVNVNDIDGVNSYINKYKKIYKNATHYCFGYIIGAYCKYSDDGEPSGTAGLPILNVLKYNNLGNILCIVIRYFGGIKLGSGGLIRAYSNCTKEAINKSDIVNLVPGYNITIEFSYDMIKLFDSFEVVSKEFNDKVRYNLNITKEEYDKIKALKASIINEKEILVKR